MEQAEQNIWNKPKGKHRTRSRYNITYGTWNRPNRTRGTCLTEHRDWNRPNKTCMCNLKHT